MPRFPFLRLPKELQLRVIGSIDDVLTAKALLDVPEIATHLRDCFTLVTDWGQHLDYFNRLEAIGVKKIAEDVVLEDVVRGVRAKDDMNVYFVELEVEAEEVSIQYVMGILRCISGRMSFVVLHGMNPDSGNRDAINDILEIYKDNFTHTALLLHPGDPTCQWRLSWAPPSNIMVTWIDVLVLYIEEWASFSGHGLKTRTPMDSLTLFLPPEGSAEAFRNLMTNARSLHVDYGHSAAEDMHSRFRTGPGSLVLSDLLLTNVDSHMFLGHCLSLKNITILPPAQKEFTLEIGFDDRRVYALDLNHLSIYSLENFTAFGVTSLLIDASTRLPRLTNIHFPALKKLTLRSSYDQCAFESYYGHSDSAYDSLPALQTLLNNLEELSLKGDSVAFLMDRISELNSMRESLRNLKTLKVYAEKSMIFKKWSSVVDCGGSRVLLESLTDLELTADEPAGAFCSIFQGLWYVPRLTKLQLQTNDSLRSNLTYIATCLPTLKFLTLESTHCVPRGDTMETDTGTKPTFSSLECFELFSYLKDPSLVLDFEFPKLKKLFVHAIMDEDVMSNPIVPGSHHVFVSSMPQLQDLSVTASYHCLQTDEEPHDAWGEGSPLHLSIVGPAPRLTMMHISGDASTVSLVGSFDKLMKLDLTEPLSNKEFHERLELFQSPVCYDCPLERLEVDTSLPAVIKLKYKSIGGVVVHEESEFPSLKEGAEIGAYERDLRHWD